MAHQRRDNGTCETCGVRYPCLEALSRVARLARMRRLADQVARGELVPGLIACTRGVRPRVASADGSAAPPHRGAFGARRSSPPAAPSAPQ